MSDDLALLETAPPRATLTLNRPDARNALSEPLLKAARARLAELLAMIEAGEDVRTLVVRGEGKAFCAGMDLRAVLDDPSAPARLLRALAEFTIELRSLPAVTIARVQGAAIGGGCGLACVCDLSLTHDQAKVGFPEVDLGVCPAVVAPWVVRRVGAGRARQILLSGGLLTGAQAATLGLVSASQPDETALDAALESLVSRVSGGGGRALRATKALLNSLDGSDDPGPVLRGAAISAEVLAGEEARSMLRARREQR